MIEMGWARSADREAIIDFCDYVFSKAHCPHDFQTLLPKLYGKNGDATDHHFVIREDGKIMATILAYPVIMHLGDMTLTTLGIGSVSVHPRAQSKGYMKLLMGAVDQCARDHQATFAVLGGQRQRYGYFGFQTAGYQLTGRIIEKNIRHGLSHVDESMIEIVPMTDQQVGFALSLYESQPFYSLRPANRFLDITRSWHYEPIAILHNSQMVGYALLKPEGDHASISEIMLADESLLPAALKKLCAPYATVQITAAPWHKTLARTLTGLCEDWNIHPSHMFKIYREDFLRSALNQAGLDGHRPIEFDGFEYPLPLFVHSADTI